jgi:hypothetical protein
MRSRTFTDYLKYSGVWAGIVLNPYHWEIAFRPQGPDEMNPNMRSLFVTVGPVWIRVVIDDGAW